MSKDLSKSFELNSKPFEEIIKNAYEKIKDFAIRHNWQSHVIDQLIKKVRIFSSKKAFDDAVISAFNLNTDTQLSKNVSAIIANDVLLMVSPEVYLEIYPQGMEENFYEKLIIHELAHTLHIRILNGDEDKMGPRWFYEGFAIHVANQFEGSNQNLSQEEILSIITSEQDISYQKYKEVLSLLLEKTNIEDLVEYAWKPDFIDWAKELLYPNL